MTQPAFNPSLHPRWPAGHANGLGGKFMPAHMRGTPLWNQQVAAAAAKHQAKHAAPAVPAAPSPAKATKAATKAAIPAAPVPKVATLTAKASRLRGPAPSWTPQYAIATPGSPYSSWGNQYLSNGQIRSVRQWFVVDPNGMEHGPFGTSNAAANYYSKYFVPTVPTPKVPAAAAPIPAGVTTRTTKVPKVNAAGQTRMTTQHWFDFQGQSYGPYATAATMNKQIAIVTKPPHPTATGTDLIGTPPNQHPNALAKKVIAARPAGVTRTPSTGTSGGRAPKSATAADVDLKTIADLQGFSGLPEVVTKSEMAKLANSGNYTILYRGVKATRRSSSWSAAPLAGPKTAKQIQDEMRRGNAYYGVGVYGNGYYSTPSRSTAVGYSDGTAGSVIRFALPTSAKMGDYNKLSAEAMKLYQHNKATMETKDVFADVGRYAAARGYDALRVTSGIVVLNRTILKIQDA